MAFVVPAWLHLALSWQGDNDAVMLVSFQQLHPRVAAVELSYMQRFSHRLLVVLKAWEEDYPDEFFLAPYEPLDVVKAFPRWVKRSDKLDEWLRTKQGISLPQRRHYGLVDIPGVLWRPLSLSKTDQREDKQWPKWVRNAHCAALFVLHQASVPLTTVEVAEQCKHVYTERTMRNALERLRDGGHATAMGALNQRRSWMLSSRGLERYADLSRINQHRA